MTAKLQPSSSPVKLDVQFSAPFLRRICSYLRAPEPPGIQQVLRKEGALFGTAHEGFVSVQAFRSLPGQGFREIKSQDASNLDSAVETLLEAAKADRELKSLQLVGWYSIRALNLHGLTPREIELYDKRLQSPAPIGLVFSPEHPAKVLAELYARSAEDAFPEQCHYRRALLFNFDTETGIDEPMDLVVEPDSGGYEYDRVYEVLDSLGRGADQSWRRRIVDSILKPTWMWPGTAGVDHRHVSGEAGGARRASMTAGAAARSSSAFQTGSGAGLDGAPPSVRWKRTLLSLSLALLVIAGFAFAWFHPRGGAHSFAVAPTTRPPAIPAPARATMTPSAGLGMQVKTQGDGLSVTWDRRSPAVQRAEGGALIIDDGDQHRRVNLSAAQIAGGSVLYRPGSDDVTLALEILSSGGPINSEPVRVLDGRNADSSDFSDSSDSSAVPKSTLTMLDGNRSSHSPAETRKRKHTVAKTAPVDEESAAFSKSPAIPGDLRLSPTVRPRLRLPASEEADAQEDSNSSDAGRPQTSIHPPDSSAQGARADDGNVLGKKWRSLKRKVVGGLKYSKDKLTKDDK